MKCNDLTIGAIEKATDKLGRMIDLGRFRAGETILVEVVAEPVDALFEPVGTFAAPGATDFVAKNKFVVGTSREALVLVSYIGYNFIKAMLPKTERGIAESDLTLWKLRHPQYDLPISAELPGTIAGLGGLWKAEISLCVFYETLAHKQATQNFTWVVGYIRDFSGTLWAVDARWRSNGWSVEAHSFVRPGGWDAGIEFVSR